MPRIRRFPAGLRLSMCEESRATSAAGCAAAGLLLGFVSLRARLVGGIVGVVGHLLCGLGGCGTGVGGSLSDSGLGIVHGGCGGIGSVIQRLLGLGGDLAGNFGSPVGCILGGVGGSLAGFLDCFGGLVGGCSGIIAGALDFGLVAAGQHQQQASKQ